MQGFRIVLPFAQIGQLLILQLLLLELHEGELALLVGDDQTAEKVGLSLDLGEVGVVVVSVTLGLDLVQCLAYFGRGKLLGHPVGVGGRCLFASFFQLVLVLESDGC